MHCTVSGFFGHWQLTDAQGRRFLRRWLVDAAAGLKRAATVSSHV
jgi:hypothetical protein